MVGKNVIKGKRARAAFAMAVAVIMVISGTCMSFAGISDGPKVEIVDVNDIPGVLIGHFTDAPNSTGTTAIICTDPNGAAGGVSVLGGSPASRETDLLDPTKTVQILNAVCLSGGSAYGLDAAGGVMQYLEEKKLGVPVGITVVPIVPTACIFDLGRGQDATTLGKDIRPGIDAGYTAAKNAFAGETWFDGNVGGGTGANAGGMKGGLGSFCYQFGDLYVGVVVVVNAAGQVVDPVTGNIIAGRVDSATNTFIDREYSIVNNATPPVASRENTTIACVITNAKLTQSEANKLAEMAHDGYARAIRPTHTPSDGDTVFAMATGIASTSSTTWGQSSANMSLLGVLAVNAMERAIVSAAYNAETLNGSVGAATLRAAGTTPSQPATNSTTAISDVEKSIALRTGVIPPVTFVSATPDASLKVDKGNQNTLTINVTELYSDSTTKVLTDTFKIKKNSEGTYDVGDYKVYVKTQGNKVTECYLVDEDVPPVEPEVTLVSSMPDASVTIEKGTQNTLTINVTELYSDNTIDVLTGTFKTKKNSEGTYTVGDYQVYVKIETNKVIECYLVDEDAPPVEPEVTLVSATPEATATALKGNQSTLTVTITELYSDESVNVLMETFKINKNSEGKYEIGDYQVYVKTQGNNKVVECYIIPL